MRGVEDALECNTYTFKMRTFLFRLRHSPHSHTNTHVGLSLNG